MKKSNVMESPFYRLMGHVGDLVILNLLWLLCCLPVVTVGAATESMFAILHKQTAGEEPRVVFDFFRVFRRDFVQSTALGVILLAAGGAALWGLKLATLEDSMLSGVLAAASFLLAAAVCCCGCWGIALLARFTYQHGLLALLDGARMTVANPLPTVGILLLLGWVPLLWTVAPGWGIYLLLPLFLAGGSVSALGMTALMRPAIAQVERDGRLPDPPCTGMEDENFDGKEDPS